MHGRINYVPTLQRLFNSNSFCDISGLGGGVRSVGRRSYVIVLKNNCKKISVYLLVSAIVYHR